MTSQRPYGGNIIAKTVGCGSDVELKNDKHCATRKQLAIDVNDDFLTSFWRTKAVVTSHFAAARTLTDFLAKARLLDRDVKFIRR